MNSAPHLLGEDRADFERTLDEALRAARDRPDLAAVGRHLTARQLRGMALDAQSLIAQAAAPEYERYRELRAERRAPRAASPVPAPPSSAPVPRLPGTSVLGDPAATGAGVAAIAAVLVPVLAAIAAVIFLLAGYLLRAVGATRPLADALIAFGWFFASVMALGMLAAGVGLLVTALRNGSTQIRSTGAGALDEVAQAREEWREALLERGIVPYLRRTLRQAEEAETRDGGPQYGSAQDRAARERPSAPTRDHQLPKIGYSRPDFSSPGDGTAGGSRPRYASPDFSSPDYGGPEHQPE
ncbi:hypothetical protein AB0910_15245 [Streptomyces sp. NPDC047002]|uniref:hypothetical protein n=1 Tax=Streptomyces sp. NPDC047002 TaxID=3155475 RepID=UPI0034565BAB